MAATMTALLGAPASAAAHLRRDRHPQASHPLGVGAAPTGLAAARGRVRCQRSRRAVPAVHATAAVPTPPTQRPAPAGAAGADAGAPPKPKPKPTVAQVARSGLHGLPSRGEPEPFGATSTPTGANFAVSSSSATAVSLVFFTPQDRAANRVTAEIELDPVYNRTGNVWHVEVPDLNPDLLYGYRVTGPNEPHKGQRYKKELVVVDPYAKYVTSRNNFGEPAADGTTWVQMASPVPLAAKLEVPFNWEGVTSPDRALDDLVIYEMHVRGFTKDKSSGVVNPGTYAGLMEKIPHLKRMGFNAIELLPINEFNECEYYGPMNPVTGGVRCNFWGYSTVNFFAPMARYGSQPADGRSVQREVKEMVKACHKAGIEVILDVVFNHTAEGNDQGPTVSFRGLDNRVYYMLAPEGQFYNYSGCGNTFNCNHPVVRQFIVDALRHWVTEYHIDGFRFDLASILTRQSSHWEGGIPLAAIPENGDPNMIVTGQALKEPPLIDMISNDGVLRAKKLIAEAWDAGGLYQVGAFPGHMGIWAEWNGKYRDTVRQYMKGTDGFAGEFAERLCGSPQMYVAGGRAPRHSVNFVTAHDGFTLGDVVAYNNKHNEANGENNRDGEEHNLSWNCGTEKDEGPSVDPAVLELRRRQQRNFLAALMLSQGVPMLHMGDEYGHSKGGNNNTYAHDASMNYFMWDQANKDQDGLMRFCSALVHFRHATPSLRLRAHPTGQQMIWHGHQPNQPDWSEGSRFVAFTLADTGSPALYIAFNASHLAATLTLPNPGEGRRWKLLMDTALPAPFDIVATDIPADIREAAEAQHTKTLRSNLYLMADRSTVLLRSEPVL